MRYQSSFIHAIFYFRTFAEYPLLAIYILYIKYSTLFQYLQLLFAKNV